MFFFFYLKQKKSQIVYINGKSHNIPTQHRRLSVGAGEKIFQSSSSTFHAHVNNIANLAYNATTEEYSRP